MRGQTTLIKHCYNCGSTMIFHGSNGSYFCFDCRKSFKKQYKTDLKEQKRKERLKKLKRTYETSKAEQIKFKNDSLN